MLGNKRSKTSAKVSARLTACSYALSRQKTRQFCRRDQPRQAGRGRDEDSLSTSRLSLVARLVDTVRSPTEGAANATRARSIASHLAPGTFRA